MTEKRPSPTQHAQISWNQQGTPVAEQFDDVYFSNVNGLEETRYVFLKQNNLPQRWLDSSAEHHVIGESGFGTGLNFLASWQAFEQFRTQQPSHCLNHLYFVSFEKYPLTTCDLEKAHQAWPELAKYAQLLQQRYPTVMTEGCQRLHFQCDGYCVTLDLWIGDILEQLPSVYAGATGTVDSWFLDGFAPSKNPDMWSQALFDGMARISKPDATLATFTAAGFVRRGLIEAGFAMSKAKGFGTKRDMLVGCFAAQAEQDKEQDPDTSTLNVAIIGAGIAGAALAYSLCSRGVTVDLYEREAKAASAASGNRQGAIYPLLTPTKPEQTQFHVQAFLYQQQTIDMAREHNPQFGYEQCGVLQLAHSDKSLTAIDKIAHTEYPQALVEHVGEEDANRLAALAVDAQGLHYPLGAWVNAPGYVNALLDKAAQTGKLNLHFGKELSGFVPEADRVTLSFSDGSQASHPRLVCCHAEQALQHDPQLPITPVRGQVSHIQSSPQLSALNKVLCFSGYLTPGLEQQHCLGASFIRFDLSRELRDEETQENLEKLQTSLPRPWNQQLTVADSQGRAAIRATVRDHLPLIGRYPDLKAIYRDGYAEAWQGEPLPVLENCYLLTGLGARGLSIAPLAAELLASELTAQPLPASKDMKSLLEPQRFYLRRLQKGRPLP
ncbi:bifunctional tRNA (5-methylaminomethyl-2-thiouridine)(34)-methyltransferase MnmD/FAD-dependent 5-carboxymethylaminomethyl-2-thiouridine(34) oxidoreductase MnmC [Aliagarivorans taiwanensis]|uniref:bifunctional tRNA (5-methylaminomethyl-2-thiouridine)(34)-methyltransferase MnmD/FAD-dependent 5-carboxymethylaminomethyl-2-thiouridine(34) oxidoreductase MnmC n=1 Tax=Aliagarivorans taiwanensis TaxID=561966 RepID=UPI00040B7ED9|nr:bifunctional tRNA (5-methylaminomethyl-2-thiouridine)(34)-methyltransferase MnmD/FAD-dependent 5-carboxymethylaminomethyl-2-thiouridine(34) oxidoreductase MnmC [Aliagarivorans taiwanensis]